MKLPKAKSTNLVVQELGTELLIYNLITNQAFQLNETAMIVFNACSEGRTLDDLKSKYNFTDDLVYFTLDKLNEKDLLDEPANYLSPFAGTSRRQVIRRVGVTSMMAIPLISTLVAPTVASAASGAVACTTGTGPGQLGTGGSGSGQRCSCPASTAAGTTCSYGTGSSGAANTYCKTGCTCTSTSTSTFCTSGQGPCLGTCG